MAFWSMTSSLSMAGATEKLIDRDSFTLPELLDCDDVLNQVLAPNDRVIRYLSQPDIINELVDLTLAPPYSSKPPEDSPDSEKGDDTRHSSESKEASVKAGAADNDKEDGLFQAGLTPADNHSNDTDEEKAFATTTDDHAISGNESEKLKPDGQRGEDDVESGNRPDSDAGNTGNDSENGPENKKDARKTSPQFAYESFADTGESFEYHEFQEEAALDNNLLDLSDSSHKRSLTGSHDSSDHEDEHGNEAAEEEEERQKRLRYSKISAEILTTDVWSLLDALLSNDEAMHKLWSLLDPSMPEASTQQLSLLTKIVEGLLEKRLDRMLDFIRTLPHFVDYFIRYIECQPLVDFLIKIISTDHPESPTDIINFLYDQQLVPKMIELLGPDVPHSAQSAAGDFLKAFVNISGGNKSDICAIGPNELSRQFVSTKCMKRLIELMLKGGHGMCVAVTVIIEVIRKNNSDYDFVEVMDTTLASHPPDPRDNIYLGTMVKLFARAIPKFQEMLVAPENRTMKMPFGEIKPLGFERFRICELYAELLHCSNMNLLNDPRGEEVIRERDLERVRVFFPDRLAEFEANEAEARAVEVEEGRVAKENFHNREGKLASKSSNTQDAEKNPDGGAGTTADTAESNVASSDASVSTDTEATNASTTADAGLAGSQDDGDTVSSPASMSPTAQPPHPDLDPSSPLNLIGSPGKPAAALSPENESSDELDYVESDHKKLNVSEYRGQILEDHLVRENGELRDLAVVGDKLKFALDDSECIDSVVKLLFEFPWNNFLHNVVFDIVQQVFNGYIDHSYNKFLAINLFKRAKITEQIVEGQRANDAYERDRKIRLGYVGHLTLISEEVVKFESLFVTESISPNVFDALNRPEWNDYVKNDLLQLREQYNTVLGRAGSISEEEESFDIQEDDESRVRAIELNLIEDEEAQLDALRRPRSDSDSDTDSESDSDSDAEDVDQDDGDDDMLALTPQRHHRSSNDGENDAGAMNISDPADDLDNGHGAPGNNLGVSGIDVVHQDRGPSSSKAERAAEIAAMHEANRSSSGPHSDDATDNSIKLSRDSPAENDPEHDGDFARYMSQHFSRGPRKFDSESSEDDDDEQQGGRKSTQDESWTPVDKDSKA